MQPIFFERDFTNRVQPLLGWTVGRLRWTDEGGAESAELTAVGDWGKIWELAGMLRAPVEIHAETDMGDRCWWGYVNEVRIVAEGYSVTLTLETLANKVQVAYSLVTPGATGAGERATTDFASDTISQAEYGIKEAILSGGNLGSAAAAENLRATQLAARKGPQPAISWGKSETIRAEVHCRGWFATLGWRLASWASVAGVSFLTNTTNQIFGGTTADTRLMQQFTTGVAAPNVLSASIYGRKSGAPTDNMILEIFALDGSGNPTGSALTSGTLAGTSMSTVNSWVEVTFTEYELAASTQYGLVARRSGAIDAANYYVWNVDTGLGYSGGAFKLYNGSAWGARPVDADGAFIIAVNNQVAGGSQLEQLVSTYGQFITAQVFEVAASSTPALPSYRDGDTDTLSEVLGLMRAGTTNSRRIVCQVDLQRRAVWSEEPAPTAALAYRVMRDGLILDAAGAPLPLTQPPYGGWALFGDVPATAGASLILDVTRQYIRAVEWTPGDGWKPEFREDTSLKEAVGGGNAAELRPFVQAWTAQLNKDGGYMVRLINKTGGASVKGHVVSNSSTTANAVEKIVVGEPDPIGVFYESGVADGDWAWVVVSGIADVYFVGSTTLGHLARGFVSADAGYVTGQALSEAVPSSPFATDKHFYEIGHVLEARSGAGLAKCVLHFN